MTLVGLVIAVYALRPVLSVGSLNPSDLHAANGAKASITVTGTGIRDVKVKCVTNKVIFDDRDTLAFNRFTSIDEYAVNDVGAGESFTADCNFVWSWWKGQADNLFLMGGGSPGKPQLGIAFTLKDGLPVLIPGSPLPATVIPALGSYSAARVTAVDGDFIVTYKWALFWFYQERLIHMIAQWNGDELKWRVAPNSEPVIPTPNGGFIVTANGPPEGGWGVTMKRGVAPSQ